jgi:hypothetical protein
MIPARKVLTPVANGDRDRRIVMLLLPVSVDARDGDYDSLRRRRRAIVADALTSPSGPRRESRSRVLITHAAQTSVPGRSWPCGDLA